MKAYPNYNRLVLIATLAGLLTVKLFNSVIDPYGIIGGPAFAGLNQEKPKEASHVRLFKAVDTFRISPRAVFLGTSRVEYGLDPDHPALATYQPVYNLGLPDSNAYEQLRYLEHAIANQPDLELVVLGLDFFSYNTQNVTEADFRNKRLERNRLLLDDFLSVTLSADALDASIDTVIENADQDQEFPYDPDGMRNEAFFTSQKPTIEVFREYIGTYLKQPHLYGNYSLSTEMLGNLKAIVELCEKHDVELKVFISPSHASQLEAIYVAGLWSVFEEWKRRVVEITPAWDFSVYDPITTEPITAEMQYFKDSVHYREEVGDLILNRMLKYRENDVSEGFGVLLTSDNITAHLAEVRSDREHWLAQNSEVAEMVQELKLD